MKILVSILHIAIVFSVSFVCTAEEILKIVPYPQNVVIEKGYFNVAGATIRYSDIADTLTIRMFDRLADQLS